ncbi:sensor histidine kinase [Paracoccus benzoatiresistens]|uniref:histidine kinase n=1 Tax=Paracoccus benzoatiresistens TaxID=2997341 RepID=A0ABT4J1U0_9RHOB|nr:HWE histidine kinase domain-containing protein [Paracoccus sp. EF6]MCZ0961065.1 PAS domain-containing protein [Paracoccus sp. EF6]
MRASYFELEEDGDSFHLAARFEHDSMPMPERMRLSDFSPALGDAYRSGRTLMVADASVQGELVAAPETYAAIGVAAWAAVPLMSSGRLVAWIGVHSSVPRDWSTDDLRTLDDVAERTWGAVERTRAEGALRVNEEQLRAFGEASSDLLWIRDAKTLAWEYLSPAFERIYGITREAALRGDTMANWLDLILPEDRKRARDQIEKARQGERVVFDYRIIRPSDGEVRLLRDTDFPIRDAAGHITRIGGVGHDATEEQATAERLQVLVHELQHRTRNLMAVVQSVTDRTLAGSSSLEDFQERIRDRLGALARVNGLLSRLNEGDRITFDELIRTELRGHGVIDGSDQGLQVSLQGPRGLRLRSSQVQTLALGLHELATNALKYGALSRPEGRLDISWRLVPGPDGQRRLLVNWRETGIEVAMPDTAPGGGTIDGKPLRRRGYGRELIERALPYQLKAETSYELAPGGVRCTIILPLSSAPDAGGMDMEKKNA